MVEVTRTYLELRDPSTLNRKPVAHDGVSFVHQDPCPVDHYRTLYAAVGGPWHWRDRAALSDEKLAQVISRPAVAIWEMLVDGRTAGYFELERHPDGAVEIVYFGLVPEFIGRGLGGAMLTRAVDEAIAMGGSRVWLHTCTLDSPHALPNYKARGFRETGRVETYIQQID